MSNYPTGYDDDSTLPAVNDNLTEIGGDAINALRDTVMQIELALGLNIAGSQPNLAARLGVFINPDGSPNASVLTSLGLVTLPITNSQIAENAGIPESKLKLDFRTQDLFNYIRDLNNDVNTALGWISVSGIKLEPHLIGAIYRHTMDQIDVSTNSAQFLKNNLRLLRDNTQSYTLVNDINNELLAHQWADGSPFGVLNQITTNNGSLYSTYFAHTASGIFLNPSRFATIPQTKDNLQLFAEYIDTSSIFLLGTRIQNLYSAGISNVSRSSSLTTDGYGQFIVPPTPAIAFLKGIGNSGTPVDNVNNGDDIIQFVPSVANQASFYFDSQFALVKPGDIVRVLYGDGYNIEVPYRIREKKYNASSHTYIVRIAGKNQFYSPHAVARIDRPLFNNNKYGELAHSPVNVPGAPATSLVINNPRGAQALGLNFNANEFDEKHYNLYLALYPTGFAQDGYTILPAIDVTGNQGKTPGSYTLESIVQATNNAFRAPGFNYRFTAFSYQGNFGICLADSYNNAGFSILSVVQNPAGVIDPLSTALNFPNNVVDLLPTVGTVGPDPLGFGPSGAGIASPPFQFVYGSATAAISPAKLFVPLRRNNYYVNGAELERLAIPNLLTEFSTQAEDGYGDGYWVATVQNVAYPPGRTQTTYRIFQDLSSTNLKAGKTVVVQSLGAGSLIDFGRFVIESVTFNCAPNVYTDITVYDAVHGRGFQPPTGTTIQPFNQVGVYFSDDSTSFNNETATDFQSPSPSGQCKRHFEVYVDDIGSTFTQERGRFTIAGTNVTVNEGVTLYGYFQLNKMDIVTISPKLRGYQFGSVNKITLNVFSYTSATGIIDGYLASFDGTSLTHTGPRTQGKVGEVIRFYDETFHDYIDIKFDPSVISSLSDFTNQQLDFQLFPSLQLDDELLFIGTCQVNDGTQTVSKIVDQRNFGNIGTKDLNTSVYDFMSAPERYFHSNGIIRGFDIANTYSGSTKGVLNLAGGMVLTRGKILEINNETVIIPAVQEKYSGSNYNIKWALCINDVSEYVLVPLLDVDPVFGTPPTSVRTFTAVDFVSSQTYAIPAITFSDMINRRPDLTPLYIVTSVVTGTPTTPIVTIATQDVRKYAFKRDWGYRPTWSVDSNNGDFRTYDALSDWFIYNNVYSNSVNVKGTFTSLPSTITFTNPNTSQPYPVVFYGDGAATFSPVSGSFGMLAVELNNLQINAAIIELNSAPVRGCTFTYAPAGSGHFTVFTSRMENCTINTSGVGAPIQFFAGSILENVTINVSSSNQGLYFGNIVKNCTFNINTSGAAITIDVGAVVENCTFNLNGASCTWSVTGAMVNNTVKWNVVGGTQLPISCTVPAAGNSFRIVNNKFLLSASASAPSSFIAVSDTVNGAIIGNHFFRTLGAGGGTLTNGYILAPASYTSGTVAVEDNFFDSTTIDGSNQNLVINLPLPWNYKNNLNTPPTLNVRTVSSTPYTVVAIDNVLVEAESAGGATTIASSSNGQSLPQAIINVASTTGFPSSGNLLVTTSAGLQIVTYTATSGGNQFTGCTGGTGVMSTGNAVTSAAVINLPQVTLVPPGRTLTIKDGTGNFDTTPLVLHRALITETVEGLTADYVYNNPYGSLTLVAVTGGWIII
jgi:hypothetical protein